MEFLCQNCQYTFCDKEMFDFHKDDCDNLKNQEHEPDHDKKKFFCPLCNKHFRLFKNLKTHSETIKHLDLLEWRYKQSLDTLSTTNSNIKEVIVTNSSLIEKKQKYNSNHNNSEEEESEFSISMEIDKMIAEQPDEFFSQITSINNNTSNSINVHENSSENPLEELFKGSFTNNTFNNTSDNTFNNTSDNTSDNTFDGTFDNIIKDIPDNTNTFKEDTDDLLSQLIASRDRDLYQDFKETPKSINNNISNVNNVSEPIFNNFHTEFQTENISSQNNLSNLSNHSINNVAGNDFLDQLMKSREKELDNIRNTPRTPQTQTFNTLRTPQTFNTPRTPQTHQNSLNLNIEIQLPEEDDSDILEELKNTKKELADNFNKHQNTLTHTLENKLEYPENNLLNALTTQRDKDYIKEKEMNSKDHGIVYGQPTEQLKTLKYPIQYHQHPLWQQLTKIIKEKDAPRRLVAILLGSPITDYPIIYAFIRLSDKLDGKKQKDLRMTLVQSILEVQKHLVSMLHAGQLIWGQKEVKVILLVMTQWKISDYYNELKNELKSST